MQEKKIKKEEKVRLKKEIDEHNAALIGIDKSAMKQNNIAGIGGLKKFQKDLKAKIKTKVEAIVEEADGPKSTVPDDSLTESQTEKQKITFKKFGQGLKMKAKDKIKKYKTKDGKKAALIDGNLETIINQYSDEEEKMEKVETSEEEDEFDDFNFEKVAANNPQDLMMEEEISKLNRVSTEIVSTDLSLNNSSASE